MLLIFAILSVIVIGAKNGGYRMLKYYSEPVVEIRKYSIAEDVSTDPSNPDQDKNLHDDDEYDYFG